MPTEMIILTIRSSLYSNSQGRVGTTHRFITITIHVITLLSFQCGLDVEDPTPPNTPVWVPKSQPNEWPERGIDAHESGGIYLEWELNPSDDLSAMLLYRADYDETIGSLGEYELISKIETHETSNNEYIDQYVIPGKRYYYKLKSVDQSDNVSQFSDSLAYCLLYPQDVNYMRPNGLTDTIVNNTFHWTYNYNIEMEDYYLTVISYSSELVLRETIQPTNYIGGSEAWTLPVDYTLNDAMVYKWRIDMGASYVSGVETKGSESPWVYFVYKTP